MDDLKLENIISGHKINEDDAAWLRGALAAKGVPAVDEALRLAAERTREDLGPNGPDWGDIRALIAFAKKVIAATPAPAQAQQVAQGVPADTPYKSMFEAAVVALAEIDALLGVDEDGCNDPQQTVSALKDYIAGVAASKATPAQAQQAAPMTQEQVNSYILKYNSTSAVVRAVERDRAEAWGVKLAGIGASSGSAS